MQKSSVCRFGAMALMLGVFTVGSGVASASDIVASAPGLLRVAMTGSSQITAFVAAAEAIKSLNAEGQAALKQKGLTAVQKEKIKESYLKKETDVLAAHHLTAAQYASMLKRTQTDPAFAKQVEAAMR